MIFFSIRFIKVRDLDYICCMNVILVLWLEDFILDIYYIEIKVKLRFDFFLKIIIFFCFIILC